MPSSPAPPLRLFAEASTLPTARILAEAGVDAIIHCGRSERCRASSGEKGSLADWTAALAVPVIARIRRMHAGSARSIEAALAAGASGIALPGAHSAGEVDTVVRLVRGRAATFIHVDTPRLLADIRALARIDWTYLHVGVSALAGGGDGQPVPPIEVVRAENLTDTIARLAPRPVGFVDLPLRSGGALSADDLQMLSAMARCGGSVARLHVNEPIPERVAQPWIRSIRMAWTHAQPTAATV
jgi:hypothetical protein